MEYFEGHYSMRQVLESVANQVGMNNPPKSTIFSWFKRHRKLSVHCPYFFEALTNKYESNDMRQNTEFFFFTQL